MSVECTFCNDTKKEPGQEGPCMWCTGSIAPKETGTHTAQRFTIARLRYAGGEEHNVKYVSEVDYDRVVAELAELAKPCAALNCQEPRVHGTMFCPVHRTTLGRTQFPRTPTMEELDSFAPTPPYA